MFALIVWITGCALWVPIFFRYSEDNRGIFKGIRNLESIQLIRLVLGGVMCLGSSRWILQDFGIVHSNSWIVTELVSLVLRILLLVVVVAAVRLFRSMIVSRV
jgi:uncharacterized membrane protein